MDAIGLLRAGKLAECLEEAKAQVRREPAAVGHRLFLFQVLALTGDWERAANQLVVTAELSPAHRYLRSVYGPAIEAESVRRAVFAGERLPAVLGEPEEWVAQLVEANWLQGRGEAGPAQDLRRAALNAAPAIPGSLNSQPFAWLADADERLGPVLETIVDGRYLWVPLTRVRSLRMEPPTSLHDRVWVAAQFTWVNGGESLGLIPARYPGTERTNDADLLLGRKTDWTEPPGAPSDSPPVGLGQRMLATDADDYGLFDVRLVRIGAESEPGPDAAAPPVGVPDEARAGAEGQG